MNGKKAKQLRRKAEKATVGMPTVAYRKHDNQILRRVSFLDTDELTETKLVKEGDWMPVTMMRACTRWVYKQLKKD